MKRFDKGYIYASLLTDLFSSIVIFFLFLQELFVDEDASAEQLIAAIPWFLLAICVIYLCFITYRIMYYRTSGYELTDNEIKCNRGVFFRRRSVVDYKKIHAINKKQNLIHRIFGIAVLTVDSGSANTSHQAEITIVEKNKTVDALLSELNRLKANGMPRDTEAADTNAAEVLLSDKDSLYRFTSAKKMLYTLINIATTAFFTAVIGVLIILVLGICKWLLALDFLGTWGEYFLFAVMITLGAMLLASFFSFVGCLIHSFIGYYNFKIQKRDNNIQISFGLLEKHTNTFSYDRIKAVKISQGIIQRMLGFASIKLEVIGYTNETGNDSVELGVLVPFCKYDEIGEILTRVLPEYIPSEKQTKSVSLFPFLSWFLLFFWSITGIALITTVALMAILGASTLAIWAVVLSVLGAAVIVTAFKLASALLSYQNNGLAVEQEKISVYSGGFIKTVTVFMAKHLVAVENVTTPCRQRHGIASLVLHLRTNADSNEVKVHMQKDALALDMEKLLPL